MQTNNNPLSDITNKVTVNKKLFLFLGSLIWVNHLTMPLSSPNKKIAHKICQSVSIRTMTPYSLTEKVIEYKGRRIKDINFEDILLSP